MLYLFCGILSGAVLAAICAPLFRKEETLESAIIEETEWDLLQRNGCVHVVYHPRSRRISALEPQLLDRASQRSAGSKERPGGSCPPQGRTDRSDRQPGDAKRIGCDRREKIQTGSEGFEVSSGEGTGETGNGNKMMEEAHIPLLAEEGAKREPDRAKPQEKLRRAQRKIGRASCRK